MLTEVITRKIPFCDIDAKGVMWHGNYIKYFEEARHKLFEKFGFSYEESISEGVGLPVISMNIKYIRPCRFFQQINIEATLVEAENFLIIKHKMTDSETNQKLSTAEVKHIAFCLKTKKTFLKLPDFILAKIKQLR